MTKVNAIAQTLKDFESYRQPVALNIPVWFWMTGVSAFSGIMKKVNAIGQISKENESSEQPAALNIPV